MNILIPNATGPNNIGDQAALRALIFLLRTKHKEATITIHSSNPELYREKIADKLSPHLYFWSVFQNLNPFVRMFRLIQLIFQYILIRFNVRSNLAEQTLIDILNDYQKADLIVFVGGGYFRSNKGIKQALNLFMVLSSFYFGKQHKAKKLIGPMSFGPFAYHWQEQLVANILRGFDIVSVRENISFEILREHQIDNVILSIDHALLLRGVIRKKESSDFILGFTLRKWLDKKGWEQFENQFLNAMEYFSKDKNILFQPIVQVRGSKYGEFDTLITQRISVLLKKRGFRVLPIKEVGNVDEALLVYANIDLLLGMRMHSNIFAALSGTPFVAISYEYKTEGIMELLGVKEYSIPCTKISARSLFEIIERAYQSRDELSKKLTTHIDQIRKEETKRWHEIL